MDHLTTLHMLYISYPQRFLLIYIFIHALVFPIRKPHGTESSLRSCWSLSLSRIPLLLSNPKVHYRVHRSPPPN